ncbi:RNA polymerase sigma factor [bacterium]|nr:RNA polymerase sigma factor [bacterium]
MTDRRLTTADAALIEGFLGGDRDAVRTLDGWVARIVRLRAWRLRRDEDLVQDILLDLLRNLGDDRFEGRSSLKTYVERMAKYRCIDAIRRERLRRHVSWEEGGEPEPARDDSPERRAVARDEIRLAFAILSRLPARCRELLGRVLAEDASYEELAREQGVATGTIKSRVARCRQRANELRRRAGGSP